MSASLSGRALALSLLMLAHASAFTTVGLFPAALPTRSPLGSTAAGAFGRKGGRGGGSRASPRGKDAMPRSGAMLSSASRGALALRAAFDEPLFEKDVIEFALSAEVAEAVASATALQGCEGKTMLGAIVEPDVPTVQPLCVREKGSKELYADSRLEPFELPSFGLWISSGIWMRFLDWGSLTVEPSSESLDPLEEVLLGEVPHVAVQDAALLLASHVNGRSRSRGLERLCTLDLDWHHAWHRAWDRSWDNRVRAWDRELLSQGVKGKEP